MIGDSSNEEISLYFHIPFCAKKCSYCHFYVVPDNEQNKDTLLEAFKLEWARQLPLIQGRTVSTIYFGGGTPFLFGPTRMGALLDFIRKDITFSSSTPEITLEANPEDVTIHLMQDYARIGINRVSIGIQTLDDRLLQLLGRSHGSKVAIQAVYATVEAGIHNISIDLMYDLPYQTLDHWESTLEAVSHLPITHLSLYNLTIEPHTLFFKQKDILNKHIPDEQVSLDMYQKAIQVLESKGLLQYEISAFSKPGCESLHNIGYWTARPFLGFGPSAFSYWDKKRFRNVAHLKKYSDRLHAGESPVDYEEQLDPQAALRELLVVQMRLKSGVSLKEFQKRHGQIDQETFKTLDILCNQGFINFKGDILTLTDRGVLFYDTVASELI